MGKILKKWGILIVSLFFIAVIAVLCMLGMSSINKYKATIDTQNQQISNLESSLTEIGPLITGYVVTRDVRPGERITEENIDELLYEVSVPEKLTLQLVGDNDEGVEDTVIQSKSELMNMYFKIGLREGTVITLEDVIAEDIEDSWRYYDLILDDSPVGIQAGDYVDIRISFPFGEDFIAISHKKIEEINTGVIFCRKSECIVSHWVKDVVSVHAQVTAVNICCGVALRVTYVQSCCGRIREHIKNIHAFFFWKRRIFSYFKSLVFFPIFLPFRLD